MCISVSRRDQKQHPHAQIRASIARCSTEVPEVVSRYKQAQGESCGPEVPANLSLLCTLALAQPRRRRFHLRDK